VTANLVRAVAVSPGYGGGSYTGAGYTLVTTSPDEFFAQPMDVVDICTPNHLHLEQCQRALEAGMAVYMRKTASPGPTKEAHISRSWLEKHGAITQVAFTMRYIPAHPPE